MNPLSSGWSIIDKACTCPNSAPDFGCVLQTAQNVMNLGVALGVLIVTFAIAYAGFLYILAPVSASNKEMAKSTLTNAFIGLVLVLGAWLIVDFVMKSLYGENGRWGPWQSIITSNAGSECIKPKDGTSNIGPIDRTGGDGGLVAVSPSSVKVGDVVQCYAKADPKNSKDPDTSSPTYPGKVTAVQSNNTVLKVLFDTSNPASIAGKESPIPTSWCRKAGGGGSRGGGACGGALSSYTCDAGVASQYDGASSGVKSLLSCMAGKLPANVGRLSAITDSYSQTDTAKIKECAQKGSQGNSSCAHTVNSCHYGGKSCQGSSYAVDFGDQQNVGVIRAAAHACNSNARWNPAEISTHVHISVGASCGCDETLPAS